jgi:uncharacterized membrane protein YphA (DoxX/SURF4 family)
MVLVRWIVGGLFIYMGLSKALDPVGFLKLVREYDVVTNPFLLNTIAAALPWFEVFCGVLLLTGIAVRGASLMLILMLVPFTIMVLNRALDIASVKHLAFCAVKFDCGCGAGEVFICNKLTENALLTIASALFLAGWGKRLSLWYSPAARQSRTGPDATPPATSA